MDHLIYFDAGVLPRMPFGTRGKEGGVELIDSFVVDTVSAPSWQIMLSKRPGERIISAEKMTDIFRRACINFLFTTTRRMRSRRCKREWASLMETGNAGSSHF